MRVKTDEYKLFRAEVKKVKELNGWTNRDIAQQVGYSESYVSLFMCGFYASNKLVKSIADVCGIEV